MTTDTSSIAWSILLSDMTELDLDLSTDDAFERTAYRLPDDIPVDMRALHKEIITRLRNESRAVSVGTNIQILIERMAWFYIWMKNAELHPEGDPLTAKELMELNKFWLAMHSEYNKLITSAESKSRIALLQSVQDILRSSLALLDEQPEKKLQLQESWRAQFEELGL